MGEPLRLIVVYLSSPLVLVSLRPVSPRTDRLVNTLCLPTLWVSNSASSEKTRWTLPSLPTARTDLRKSKRRCLASSRRLDMTPRLLPPSFPHRDLQTSPSVFPCRMSTKLEVLEQY